MSNESERAAFNEAMSNECPEFQRPTYSADDVYLNVRSVARSMWLAGIAYASAASARETGAEGAFIDIVFDGPPSRESGRFVEVEDEHGRSFNAGEWIDRGNGLWALRIFRSPAQAPVAWKTTHPAVCVPITEDREIAEQWRAHGYQVIEFFDRPVFAMAAEAVPFEITEQAAAEWASRHDVDHVLKHFSTQRNAIEDARTLHLLAAAPQPAQADARVGLAADSHALNVRAALIGLAKHVRACDAYSKLVGDMDMVDKAIDLLAAHPGQPEPCITDAIPRVHGVSRFADNPCTVLVMLMAEATDDALRAIHDRLTSQPEPRAEVTDDDKEDAARWRHFYGGHYIICKVHTDGTVKNLGGGYVAKYAIDAARTGASS